MADQPTIDPLPENRLVRFSGTAFLEGPLERDQEVHVQVINADGELIANAYGRVDNVTERTRRDGKAVEYIHMIKVS